MKCHFTIAAVCLLPAMFTGCTCGEHLLVCSEGIHVVIETASGNNFPPNELYSIEWVVDESSGSVSSEDPAQFSYQPEALTFDIPWTAVESNEVEVAFYMNGNLVGTAQTLELEWVTTVCNPSDGSPRCDDSGNTVANAAVTFVIDKTDEPAVVDAGESR